MEIKRYELARGMIVKGRTDRGGLSVKLYQLQQFEAKGSKVWVMNAIGDPSDIVRMDYRYIVPYQCQWGDLYVFNNNILFFRGIDRVPHSIAHMAYRIKFAKATDGTILEWPLEDFEANAEHFKPATVDDVQ